jgi:hypothetical protein
MNLICLCTLLSTAAAVQFASPITSAPICINKNTVQPPTPPDLPLVVNRVAWPVLGTSFDVPVTVNNAPGLSSPTTICMNCDSPPCPVSPPCDVGALYWSVAFDNVVVPPGPIVFPDTPTLPETVVTFYEPWVPSTTPAPTPPAASRTPSPSASAAPCTGAAAAVTPVCEPCSPCTSNDSSTVVGIAVAFGFVVAAAGGLCAYIMTHRRVECPYCDIVVTRRGLKKHLEGCSEHLKAWAPVVVDRVRIVREPVVVPVEDREDEVARPEGVALVTTAVR